MFSCTIVVQAANEQEVSHLLGQAAAMHLPVTFRAAGTSLSGQAGTNGILVDVSRHWRSAEVLEDGAAVRVTMVCPSAWPLLVPGSAPVIRVSGTLEALRLPPVSGDAVERMLAAAAEKPG